MGNAMTEELEEYIAAHISPEPAVLQRLDHDTHLQLLYPTMCSGHIQGRLLKMLVRMVNPQRVLELGTYSGYSALCLAEGLLSDKAVVHTIEVDDELEDFITSHLSQAPWGHRVHLHIGDAAAVLPTIEGDFDMAFIDANKRDYTAYYDLVMPRVRKGGFIVVDNTLWYERVVDQQRYHDAQTQGIRDFNDRVANDPRVEVAMIPLRDGLTIIYKK